MNGEKNESSSDIDLDGRLKSRVYPCFVQIFIRVRKSLIYFKPYPCIRVSAVNIVGCDFRGIPLHFP
jgi:hypothetical protein